MPVRTTLDIPEPLHQLLRHKSEESGSSIRSLIVRAIEQVYAEAEKRKELTGPIIRGTGKLGPAFPSNENPHDVVLS